MKDLKFKKVSNDLYKELSCKCEHWCNKYCNNGVASLTGLRQCYGWSEAYIVLCNNIYMAIPYELFKIM